MTTLRDYKSSSGDEIANVNVLRRHRLCTVEARAYAHLTEFLILIIRAITKLGKRTQNKGHFAVEGHSRSFKVTDVDTNRKLI